MPCPPTTQAENNGNYSLQRNHNNGSQVYLIWQYSAINLVSQVKNVIHDGLIINITSTY
jgi:hypothetical protein